MIVLRLAIISTLLLLVVASTNACSIAYPLYKVRSSFWVKIYHEGKPVAGIGAALYRYNDKDRLELQPLLDRTSDKDGIVKIENLPVGKYFVSVSSPGGGGAADLLVEREDTWESRNEVGLSWPFAGVIKAKQLAGVLLNDAEIINSQISALKNAELALWEPGAQASIQVTATDSSGKFAFKISRPGLYILRVKSSSSFSGDIPFEILPQQSNGPNLALLHLQMTSCGLRATQEIDAAKK